MSTGKSSETGPRVCRFCRGARLRPVYTRDRWTVARCLDCRHYTTIPWPTDRDLESAYGREYFETYGMWSPDPAEQRRLIAAYADLVRRLEDFVKPPARLIEIGSGTGFLTAAALERGWDVVGYDPSEAAVTAGSARLGDRLRAGSIEEAALRETEVDALVAYHVLEHTPDPRRFLQLAHTMLRPGGWLAIEVPHVRSFDTRWLPDVRSLVLDVPRHLCHFTPKTLVSLVEETGFEVVQVDGMATALFHRLRTRVARAGQSGPVGPALRPYQDDLVRRLARRWMSGFAFTVYARRSSGAA